jgi:hypothetical protein
MQEFYIGRRTTPPNVDSIEMASHRTLLVIINPSLTLMGFG